MRSRRTSSGPVLLKTLTPDSADVRSPNGKSYAAARRRLAIRIQGKALSQEPARPAKWKLADIRSSRGHAASAPSSDAAQGLVVNSFCSRPWPRLCPIRGAAAQQPAPARPPRPPPPPDIPKPTNTATPESGLPPGTERRLRHRRNLDRDSRRRQADRENGGRSKRADRMLLCDPTVSTDRRRNSDITPPGRSHSPPAGRPAGIECRHLAAVRQ